MKVSVDIKTKKFYLAYAKWEEAIGHEITVGKYKFSAVSTKRGIIISEVSSGTHILTLPMTQYVYVRTATKEMTLEFLKEAGEGVKRLIQDVPNLEKQIKKTKLESFKRCGPMPDIEYYDSDWIFEESKGTH